MNLIVVKILKRFSLIVCSLAVSCGVCAQSLGSTKGVSLAYLLDMAAATYPSILGARLEARASNEDVAAMERIRWPTLTATIESDSGNVRSFPSRALQVEQTIWDAGRNTARISEAKALSDISVLKVYLQQQELFLQVVASWQNLIASTERVRAAKLTLNRLEGYQAQMRRRVEADASPRIDLELIEARLLQTEVELKTAETNLQVAVARLEMLTGVDQLVVRATGAIYPLVLSETQIVSTQFADTDWNKLAIDHPSSSKARLEVLQVRHRLEAKQAESFPQVFARLYKPIGTITTSTDTSTTGFLGMRYSPGPGFANFEEAKAISTRITSSEQAVETTIREVHQTFRSDYEEFSSARLRIATLEKSVVSSAMVLESFQRQFQAGRKQWLDLLNQVRDLAQNQYSLADAQASMLGAMYRLQIRSGQNLK